MHYAVVCRRIGETLVDRPTQPICISARATHPFSNLNRQFIFIRELIFSLFFFSFFSFFSSSLNWFLKRTFMCEWSISLLQLNHDGIWQIFSKHLWTLHFLKYRCESLRMLHKGRKGETLRKPLYSYTKAALIEQTSHLIPPRSYPVADPWDRASAITSLARRVLAHLLHL